MIFIIPYCTVSYVWERNSKFNRTIFDHLQSSISAVTTLATGFRFRWNGVHRDMHAAPPAHVNIGNTRRRRGNALCRRMHLPQSAVGPIKIGTRGRLIWRVVPVVPDSMDKRLRQTTDHTSTPEPGRTHPQRSFRAQVTERRRR